MAPARNIQFSSRRRLAPRHDNLLFWQQRICPVCAGGTGRFLRRVASEWTVPYQPGRYVSLQPYQHPIIVRTCASWMVR